MTPTHRLAGRDDLESLRPGFLGSGDVDAAAFDTCDPNQEIILIHCPKCRQLMAWCCECDTLFPDLRDPQRSMPVTMLDSTRDRIECSACGEPFEDFFFLRLPAVRKYLVTRDEVVQAGFAHLLA